MSKQKPTRRNMLHTLSTRLKILSVIGIVLGVLLIGRLFYLQIIQGNTYYDQSVNITQRETKIEAPRGNILDRNGNILATNETTYSVTIKDTTAYPTQTGEFNEMILRLVNLLERYGQGIVTPVPIILNEHDEYVFNGTESAIRRFIRDVYGTDKIQKRQEDGEDPYADSAEQVMTALKKLYNFESSKWPNAANLTKAEGLKICNVRYAMSATTFTKYRSTTICSNVSSEVQAAILEEQSNMQGVEVEEKLKRVYPDGTYFAHILGYTGTASEEDLETLQEEDDSYVLGDTVGRDGIEQAYETQLKGTKGSETLYLNNVGLVQDTANHIDPVNGNDVQLTIDKDLQIATYNIIERRLAEIIVNKVIEDDFTPTTTTSDSEFKIPIKTVYFQMINNNILSLEEFSAADASESEKAIYNKFTPRLQEVLEAVSADLTASPQRLNSYSDEVQEYLKYVYSLLSSSDRKIITGVDTSSAAYVSWREGNSSLYEFLHTALSNGWIDSSKINSDEEYSNVEDLYNQLIAYVMDLLPTDTGFAKLVYKYLIQSNTITGNEICLALFAQGVLENDAEAIQRLQSGSIKPVDFMKEKISTVEITPAQLALDPCSGSATVVDETNGNILAMVSYPGYDINYFSGSIDASYYKQVNTDLSQPFYNRATQTRTSPGSTYKMITASADLEEGLLTVDDKIQCTGTYERLNHPKCWIARETPGASHSFLNVSGALRHSCNIFFYESGYRMSLDENGKYVPELGLEKLNKYAELYGFGSLTGLEIRENVSQVSDQYPVPSAIGQGTNNFTAISVARYATAVATKGNVYEFKLMDNIKDTNGNVIAEGGSSVLRHLDFADTTWNALHEGMLGVTHEGGSAYSIFQGFSLNVAGKSGTAQENLLRGNHALFVSFGPYESPEIVTTVSLPNAYTSANAARVTKSIYEYYTKQLTLDEIRTDAEINADEENVRMSD